MLVHFARAELVFLLGVHGLVWGWAAFVLPRCRIFGHDTLKLEQILHAQFLGECGVI